MWTPTDRALVGDFGSGRALTDDQFRLLEPLLPPAKFGGRPRTSCGALRAHLGGPIRSFEAGGEASGRARRVGRKESEDLFSERVVEPYHLMNGLEGWYVAAFDPNKADVRHFRLDRIKVADVMDEAFEQRPEVAAAADLEGWARTGQLEASRMAKILVSPERARWEREEHRVAQELEDGAIVIERGLKGTDWLVR